MEVSTATLVVGLVKTCYKIWTFLDKVKLGNVFLLLLSKEIESFSDMLLSIERILNDKSKLNVQGPSGLEAEYWLALLNRTLGSAKLTLTNLDMLLGNAKPIRMKNLIVSLKNYLSLKTDELTLHKNQLGVHRETLQLCLTGYSTSESNSSLT